MRRILLATATSLLFLAGCSSGADSDGRDGSDDGGTTPVPQQTSASSAPDNSPASSEPACDDVWKAGQILPGGYLSCAEDGESLTPDVTACTDGTSLLVHRDMFYAVTGQKIVEPDVAPLQDTDEFGKVYASCTGE